MIGLADVVIVDQIWWYTSRAAGVVAWVLLSCSIIAGMSMATRDARVLPAGWSLDLHRFLSSLSLVFLTIHMVALVPDNYVDFGLRELLLPLASVWEPWAVAWGVVAFWLVVAVELSSLVRARLPNRLWRALHFLSFLVWLSATVHLLLAGTDSSSPVFRVVQVVVIAVVTGLFFRRLLVARRRNRRRQRARLASTRTGALSLEKSVDVDEVDTGKRREFTT